MRTSAATSQMSTMQCLRQICRTRTPWPGKWWRSSRCPYTPPPSRRGSTSSGRPSSPGRRRRSHVLTRLERERGRWRRSRRSGSSQQCHLEVIHASSTRVHSKTPLFHYMLTSIALSNWDMIPALSFCITQRGTKSCYNDYHMGTF